MPKHAEDRESLQLSGDTQDEEKAVVPQSVGRRRETCMYQYRDNYQTGVSVRLPTSKMDCVFKSVASSGKV